MKKDMAEVLDKLETVSNKTSKTQDATKIACTIILGVFILLSTLVGTWSIESAWAPKPDIKTFYTMNVPADAGWSWVRVQDVQKAGEKAQACYDINKKWSDEWDKKHGYAISYSATIYGNNYVNGTTISTIP